MTQLQAENHGIQNRENEYANTQKSTGEVNPQACTYAYDHRGDEIENGCWWCNPLIASADEKKHAYRPPNINSLLAENTQLIAALEQISQGGKGATLAKMAQDALNKREDQSDAYGN